MTPIPLTARQIKIVDEITADKRAAKLTLEIALQYHANCISEFNKTERELWGELAELHNLDFNSTSYELKRINGMQCVTEKTDEID